MASNNSSVFFLISLILFAATRPLAHGTILRGISAFGTLCCTNSGTCPGVGVPGVLVSLRCNRLLGPSVVVGQGITGVDGFFNITVPNLGGGILTGPTLPCFAIVDLPLNQTVCPPLSTVNGALVGTLVPVDNVVATVLGPIQRFRVAFFVRTPSLL